MKESATTQTKSAPTRSARRCPFCQPSKLGAKRQRISEN